MMGLNGFDWQTHLIESGWREPLFGSITGETLMWLVIAMVCATIGWTSQQYVRHHLRPHWALAAGFAVVLAYLIIELGGTGGAEFVYFQF
jgi:hypothetical protein